MLKLMYLSRFLMLCAIFGATHGQYLEIPNIACPDYFQYLNRGQSFIGKLTLPDIQLGWTTVEVQFSQRAPLESDYSGNITLFDDVDTLNNNKDNVQTLSYRIDFPLNNVVPKLTQIAVNSRVLCSTNEYKPPSTSFKMQHTVRIKIESAEAPKSFELKGADIPLSVQTSKPPQADNQPFIAPVIKTAQSLSPSRNVYLKTICGQEGNEHSGGPILRPGEFPWLAAIYEKEKTGLKFITDGSLITSRTILTSAHYFRRNNLMAEDISVFLGRYNLSNTIEDTYVQRDILTILIHPEYKAGYNFPDADVALLQLLAPVSFTQYIRPICIWNEDFDNSIIGQSAIVAGWGLTDKRETSLLVPKKLDANVVPDDECLWSSPVYSALTSSRTLCGGKRDNTGPCGGGNGVMMNIDGRWVLRAVVSAGVAKENKCDLNQYVVYTDLAKHISWIRSYMQT